LKNFFPDERVAKRIRKTSRQTASSKYLACHSTPNNACAATVEDAVGRKLFQPKDGVDASLSRRHRNVPSLWC